MVAKLFSNPGTYVTLVIFALSFLLMVALISISNV